METVIIPQDLKPSDGRFGSGPSKVRTEAVAALAGAAAGWLGTSHRRSGVRDVVAHIRRGLTGLYALPDGYEVVLGNGGSTSFWDAMTFGLVREKSLHYVFGEFSSKCAAAARAAPHIGDPEIVASDPGSHPDFTASGDADLCALTHNETSTGVAMPVRRTDPDPIVAVDATSAAGGVAVDVSEFDAYYFAPQKCFASDGGLWVAIMSPRAVARIEELSDRYTPASLDLGIALENSRKDQTYNTPALATMFLLSSQIQWFLDNGGLEWAIARCDRSAETIYGWADAHDLARPFVADPAQRSHTVATVDFDDGVDAGAVAGTLRANGIVDVEPYRKLGRNQIRVALYPAIEPEDVAALTRCVDYAIANLPPRRT